MKKLGNILPLLATLLVCIAVFFGGAFSFLYQDGDIEGVYLADTGGVPLKKYISLPSVIKDSKEENNSSNKTSSLAANAPSNAVGKIYEQFLSPYKAALNYNGIYIKNSTGLNINIKDELNSTLEMKLAKTDSPQVLIVHTHATESYMTEDRNYYTASDKARDSNNQKNVVKVGETMAEILRSGGIGVLHDKTQHDTPSYNESYSRAKKTINEYLKKYPSIKIVIDVHRDSIAMSGNDKCKPVKEINGKKAAQVMLVVGSQTGTVSGFPNWRQNFRLAIRFQQTMETMYPGLARTMLFASRKYNMNLTKGSMLLEVGTDANTLEEACYSAELAGKALLSLLNTLK